MCQVQRPKIVHWKKSGIVFPWNPERQWQGMRLQWWPDQVMKTWHQCLNPLHTPPALRLDAGVTQPPLFLDNKVLDYFWNTGVLTVKSTFLSILLNVSTSPVQTLHWHSPIQLETIIPHFSSFHNASFSFPSKMALPMAPPLPRMVSSHSLSACTPLSCPSRSNLMLPPLGSAFDYLSKN